MRNQRGEREREREQIKTIKIHMKNYKTICDGRRQNRQARRTLVLDQFSSDGNKKGTKRKVSL